MTDVIIKSQHRNGLLNVTSSMMLQSGIETSTLTLDSIRSVVAKSDSIISDYTAMAYAGMHAARLLANEDRTLPHAVSVYPDELRGSAMAPRPARSLRRAASNLSK